MKKARLIISILFIILIIAEICILSYSTYSDFMKGTDDDIFGNAFDLGIATIAGALIIIPELEIWHVILYFVSDKKRKRVYKTILNIIEDILAVGILFFTFDDIFHFLPIKISENIFWIWLIIYAAVKFIHFAVWAIKEA